MAQGLDSLPLLATLPHPKVVVVELVEQGGEVEVGKAVLSEQAFYPFRKSALGYPLCQSLACGRTRVVGG